MNDPDKLRVLLPHWIEHTGEHAGEFRRWAQQVQPVQEHLQVAAQLLEQAKGRLQKALAKLGGAPTHTHDLKVLWRPKKRLAPDP
jgi:hypothetical protein